MIKTKYLVSVLAIVMAVAFSAGAYSYSAVCGPFAFAALFLAIAEHGKTENQVTACVVMIVITGLIGMLAWAVGVPPYAVQARMGTSITKCVASKGAIDPCVEEARTMYGYTPFLGSGIDWQAALAGCTSVSGARSCLEDFSTHHAAKEVTVTTADISSFCDDAPGKRTDCLLNLANKGYPFGDLRVVSAPFAETPSK